jgi:23S rRNA pseudouridine2457 synthase
MDSLINIHRKYRVSRCGLYKGHTRAVVCPMSKIILFNKPFNVLSQFTDSGTVGSTRKTLSEFIDVPAVYAAGRLDKDSEGLLVLTDDGRLQSRISEPRNKTEKCYWVQVEGVPDDTNLQMLREGVKLKDGMTAPADVNQIEEPADLWPRDPPVRFRKTVADSWLEITITEGRNRQVRRMTAAIGFPTLRLIRYRVGSWTIDDIPNGTWKDA